MSFLSRLFGKKSPISTQTERHDNTNLENNNQLNHYGTQGFTFYVDRLQNDFKSCSSIGEYLNLWVPKDNDIKVFDKVYIYHKNGPGGCLGIVPLEHRDIIFSHLLKSFDYECKVVRLLDNMCEVRCRLFTEQECMDRINQKKDTLEKELTRPYNPQKPLTTEIVINRRNSVKEGDKLIIIFDDLSSYLNNYNWCIRFSNQNGDVVGQLEYNRTTIKKILKSHFNSFTIDTEVLNIGDKKDINLKGYITRVVITPYKDNDT